MTNASANSHHAPDPAAPAAKMHLPHATHLVLIPSYNTGRELLRSTVAGALASWQPVWVIIDGSTDDSDQGLESLAAEVFPHKTEAEREAALHVVRLRPNGGKGKAVEEGMRAAEQAGFSHVLCFDADGQHPPAAIAPMMELSLGDPNTTVMGQPVFGSDAPAERLFGRKIANFFTEWESGHCGLGDTLFGMRVYPIAPALAAMAETRFGRRFDFDPEIAVRLCWLGIRPVPYPVPCRYLSREEGGVSHFNYLRDNVYQILLHVRLLSHYLFNRWRVMRAHKQHWRSQQAAAEKARQAP